jgi:hypothetical protein
MLDWNRIFINKYMGTNQLRTKVTCQKNNPFYSVRVDGSM